MVITTNLNVGSDGLFFYPGQGKPVPVILMNNTNSKFVLINDFKGSD